ncbi:bactofilin family protein [Fusobacterium perfoetens]|uniref:bactofilin family protein n=1 Tax=Fusobacterium perfoetens TaxID=852 RepID=UPI0004829FB7|nr:polymer-forming cytoskeletal protein [Fusobacterium perfoetens]
MFQPKKTIEYSGVGITMISEYTKIKGDIDISCNIYIDGKVEGSIKSTALITIGEKGEVIGSLKAERIIISGVLRGKAEATDVEFIKNGKIYGDIISSKLSIEEGVIFEGTNKLKK